MADARAFVISEEEALVLTVVNAGDDNGATDRRAELVLPEFAFAPTTGVFKEVSGIKLVIADEFPHVAMELVGSGLDRGVEHRTTRTADLGAVIVRLGLELLDSINGR